MKVSKNTVKAATIVVTVIFFISSYFYVNSVISSDELKIREEPEEKVVEEIKPIKVTLVVDPSIINLPVKTYSARLNNVDSFSDLLGLLRKEQGFTYEKTEYTYGTELDDVNGINLQTYNNPEEGITYKWRVFTENTDGTKTGTSDDIKELTLANKGIYHLTLVAVPHGIPPKN